MSHRPLTTINIHLWKEPFKAELRDLDTEAVSVEIGFGVSVFLPAKHRERAAAIVALLNEIGADAVEEKVAA